MELTIDDLVRRASTLASSGGRRLLGITGCPGAGKSMLADELAARLGPTVVALVPMDGAHLSTEELVRRGRLEWKGAIDTFDGPGFVALLERLRRNQDPTVMAPQYRREIALSIANAIAVEQNVPLVITEGIYLLSVDDVWGQVRDLLDECWYLEVADEVRLEQLVARHVRYGKTPENALDHTMRSDERNAAAVRATRHRADIVIDRSAIELSQQPPTPRRGSRS